MASKRRNTSGNHKTKGQRLDDMARKKEQRAVRAAYKKERKAESYLADDENFTSFKAQLAKMGLKLRDIPGDGNCLFRALGDQLDGDSKNHLAHRADVVDFMKSHRHDFEPFVEDDVPFDWHVANLKQPGTYAGNDAIVAFARLHGVDVVIHQLGSPCWVIHGSQAHNPRQLHISYHNGDHYSSVHKIGHQPNSQPPNVKLKPEKVENHTKNHEKAWQEAACVYSGSYGGYGEEEASFEICDESDDIDDRVAQVCSMTGCSDTDLVMQQLHDNNYDVDATLAVIMTLMPLENDGEEEDYCSSGCAEESSLWSAGGTGGRLFGGLNQDSRPLTPTNHGTATLSGARPKQRQTSSTNRKRMAKVEKKKRAEQRHRERVTGTAVSQDCHDDIEGTVITPSMAVLQI